MTIELGDEVIDKITGFKGIVVAKTEYINGCIQYEVQPKIDKDGKIPESTNIDKETIELVVPKKKIIQRSKFGGPMRSPPRMRGY